MEYAVRNCYFIRDTEVAEAAADELEAIFKQLEGRGEQIAALRARVAALEAHTSKLLELVLSFNEDDPWIFERNGGVEIVSNAQNFLKPEP